MGCILTDGYDIDTCGSTVGGTKSIGISFHDASSDYLIPADTPVAGQVIAHNDSTFKYYKFEQELETAVVTESMVANRQTNTRHFESSIEMTFNYSGEADANAALDAKVEKLTKGNMLMTVLDNSGVTKVYGGENGMRATASAGGPGTAFGDMNGIKVTFTGKEPKAAPVLIYGQTSTAAGAEDYEFDV